MDEGNYGKSPIRKICIGQWRKDSDKKKKKKEKRTEFPHEKNE